MKSSRSTNRRLEALERRMLLAHVGLDVNFGIGGNSAADGAALIAPLSGGKILVVDDSKASRLNDDGSIDRAFRDSGADTAAAAEERNASAFLIGPRVIMVGQKGNVGVVPIFLRAIDTNGAVDGIFGTDGTFTFTPESVVDGATLFGFVISSSVATSDGGIVIGVDQNLRDAQGEFQADALYKGQRRRPARFRLRQQRGRGGERHRARGDLPRPGECPRREFSCPRGRRPHCARGWKQHIAATDHSVPQ